MLTTRTTTVPSGPAPLLIRTQPSCGTLCRRAVDLSLPEGTDRQKVDAAQQRCRQHLPNGGEPAKVDPAARERMREYAKCMRAKGVPGFPDPDENGGISIRGGPDLDPKSRVFQAAERECAKHRPPGASETPDGGTRSDGG